MKHQKAGKEKLILPWQMVVDDNKATEHSKIRMYLDGTEANKLIYEIKSDMPEIADILMRWKISNQWRTHSKFDIRTRHSKNVLVHNNTSKGRRTRVLRMEDVPKSTT